jgi:hypothetical protein
VPKKKIWLGGAADSKGSPVEEQPQRREVCADCQWPITKQDTVGLARQFQDGDGDEQNIYR